VRIAAAICFALAAVITGYWKDTGNAADTLEVNRLVPKGQEPRLDGLAEPGCEIIGRVAVDAGAQVSTSRVPRAHQLILGDHRRVQISS
jgi:dTDP-glucose pyrophosphorylase